MGGWDVITIGLSAYAALGLAVAIPFLLYGIDRVDHAARGAYAMRPLLLPGVVLLWPVVALRWRQLERTPRQPS